MPRVTDEKLLRVHIQLYDDDWRFLLTCFGTTTKRSAVVRDLVRSFVSSTKARAEQAQRRTSDAGK
jgi:hypothetical protein